MKSPKKSEEIMAVKKKKPSPKKKKKQTKKKAGSSASALIFLVALILLFALYFFISRYDINFTPKAKTSVTPTEIEEKASIQDAIDHARKSLSVPDDYYSTRVKDNKVYVYIGIDGKISDLNYANMVITGQIEMAGGELLTGKELYNGSTQLLTYKDTENKITYVVKLYYTKQQKQASNKTKLAIIVDDFGNFDGQLLQDFCALDPAITFAIMPHLAHSRDAMDAAYNSGHESIIHMPMEPVSYPKNNPGKEAIYVHLTQKEIVRRVQNYMKELPYCIGANNHMGSLATADKQVMTTVLEVLKRHSMFFIDSFTTSSSVAFQTAQEMLIPSIRRDIFLDAPDHSDATLNKKMEKIKILMKKKDKIVVITHCTTRERYDYLKKFLKKLDGMDIQLIPASELFRSAVPEIS